MENIFSLKGNLNRLEFFYAFLCLTILAFGVNYLILNFIRSDSVSASYFIFKSMLDFIYLILLSPFIIRRLNDIDASAWWVLLLFVAYPFSLRNIVLIESILGYEINPFSIPILFIEFAVILLLLVLLFRASSPNKRLKFDAQKARAS